MRRVRQQYVREREINFDALMNMASVQLLPLRTQGFNAQHGDTGFCGTLVEIANYAELYFLRRTNWREVFASLEGVGTTVDEH